MAYELTISVAVRVAEDGTMGVALWNPELGDYMDCSMCSNGSFCCRPHCCGVTYRVAKAGYVTFKVALGDGGSAVIEPVDYRCPTPDRLLPDPLPGHLEIVPIPS